MAIADTVKDIKPSQWALIAGAGLGLGLLLRMRSKSKTSTSVVSSTDTPSTLNDTQGFGNYSGTGMTGWAGGAIINPGSTSPAPTTPVAVTTPTIPTPPVQPNFPSSDPENPGGSLLNHHWRDPVTGLTWQATNAGWVVLPGQTPATVSHGNEGG